MKPNPLKLNALQARTLGLLQELARHPESSTANESTGEVEISLLPVPHGNHMHIGDFVVSSRDASGFTNEAVWRALDRKGLAKAGFPVQITLTRDGLAYDTGIKRDILESSDH